MAAIGTRLHTLFHGRRVGEDEFGNRYYEARKASCQGRRTRWVIYKGIAEASKVPPAWHGWLHYTHTEPMTREEARRYFWQKEHLPNLTGTRHAYMPQGHPLRGAVRARATSDYEAWKP